MDQFDKLVKEKAEQREFKYKPLFWILFAKKAGFIAYSAMQIVSGVLIVGGIITGSVYLTQILVKKDSNAPKIENRDENYTIIDSNFQSTPTLDTLQDTITTPTPVTNTLRVTNGTNQQTENTEKQKNPNTTVTSAKKDSIKIQRNQNTNPYLGRRILTIDPDTILTND